MYVDVNLSEGTWNCLVHKNIPLQRHYLSHTEIIKLSANIFDFVWIVLTVWQRIY